MLSYNVLFKGGAVLEDGLTNLTSRVRFLEMNKPLLSRLKFLLTYKTREIDRSAFIGRFAFRDTFVKRFKLRFWFRGYECFPRLVRFS